MGQRARSRVVVLQVIDHLLQFFLGLIGARNVTKTGIDVLLPDDLCFILAKAHHSGLATLHAAHEKIPDTEKQTDGNHPGKDGFEKGVFNLSGKFDVVFCQFP